MRPSETARIAKGNAALDRAIEEAMPLCNELGVKLAGHSTLTVAVLAAYCLRLLENGVVNHGVNPPRDGTLAFIGTIADLLQVAGSSVSRGAVMTEVKHTPTVSINTKWKLVPVEPTEEMCDAGTKVMADQRERRWSPPVYRAMLAAAPELPAHDDAVVERVAKTIWTAQRPAPASWEGRLAWMNATPEERAAGIARGHDPDNYDDNRDVEEARKVARAAIAAMPAQSPLLNEAAEVLREADKLIDFHFYGDNGVLVQIRALLSKLDRTMTAPASTASATIK